MVTTMDGTMIYRRKIMRKGEERRMKGWTTSIALPVLSCSEGSRFFSGHAIRSLEISGIIWGCKWATGDIAMDVSPMNTRQR